MKKALLITFGLAIAAFIVASQSPAVDQWSLDFATSDGKSFLYKKGDSTKVVHIYDGHADTIIFVKSTNH